MGLHLGDIRRLGVPVVLYGHSTGALMALTYVVDDRPAPDLLVLSAPLLHSDITPFKQLLARILGPLLPFVRLSPELGEEHLARDPEVGRAYLADPLVETRWTVGLGAEMLRGMRRAEDLPDRMPIPTLVLHGSEDRVADPAATATLAGMPGVERKLFEGFRHEIHNEDGGTAVIDALAEWIDRQIPDQTE